jgi:hypothetical protein
MVTDTSVATCAGHSPSGRRSFRKQRTVNPPIAPARYNFLYPPQGRPTATGEPASLSREVIPQAVGHSPVMRTPSATCKT